MTNLQYLNSADNLLIKTPNDFIIHKQTSSTCIVQFFLEIFDIEKSEITDAISDAIVSLDNLAKLIDHKIDCQKKIPFIAPSISDYKNLDVNIRDSLISLRNIDDYEKLQNQIFSCINSSFISNTINRHQVYSLKNDFKSQDCTTYYLFPLINYLYSLGNYTQNIKKSFLLFSNYVQLLDDYRDIFEDLRLETKTPITQEIMLFAVSSKNFISETSFYYISNIVLKKLSEYFAEFEVEVENILDNNIHSRLFFQWKEFQDNLCDLIGSSLNNKISPKKFLELIDDIVPPIVCYNN